MIEKYTPVTRERNANHPNTSASKARHQHHHEQREREMVEAVPEPGQRLIVQKHHEVGQNGIAVYAPGADLPHQIHTHGVAAERKKGRVPQAQNAAVAPDQVDGQRQHSVTQILADESDPEGRKVKRGRSGHNLIEDRHGNGHQRQALPETSVPPAIAAVARDSKDETPSTYPPPRGRFAGTVRAAGPE